MGRLETDMESWIVGLSARPTISDFRLTIWRDYWA